MTDSDKCKEFYDFLFNRTPHYDEKILKKFDLYGIHPISQDLRLLPNRLRKIVRLHKFCACSIRWMSKRLRVPYSTLRDRIKKAESMLSERFDKWMESLPKRCKKRERDRRLDSWIGHVQTGRWGSFTGKDHQFERLYIKCPDLSGAWKPLTK